MKRNSFCPSFLQDLLSRGRSSLGLSASGNTNMSAKTQTKGPLWNKYRYTMGRKVKQDDKCGVVLGELGGNLKVLWLDDSTEFDIEEVAIANLEEFLLDEFDEDFAFKAVLEARERGWSNGTPRRKRKSRASESDDEEEEEEEKEKEKDEEKPEKEKAEGMAVDGETSVSVEIPSEVAVTEEGQGKKTEGTKSKLPAVNIPEEGMKGLTSVVYPKEICYTAGDRLLESWSIDENITGDEEMDFSVERIVDERVFKGETEYLVKWEGFQLNPGTRKRGVPELLKKGDWLPAENLEDAYALDVWEKSKPQYYLDGQEVATPKRTTPARKKGKTSRK